MVQRFLKASFKKLFEHNWLVQTIGTFSFSLVAEQINKPTSDNRVNDTYTWKILKLIDNLTTENKSTEVISEYVQVCCLFHSS